MTALITVVTVTIELVLGMGLAIVMHRTLVGRGLVRTAALVPYGIVTVVAAFSWRFAWTPDYGYLANAFSSGAPLTERASALAIIMLAEIWKTTPFMALLLLAGLALVPEDLLKAASMDGASNCYAHGNEPVDVAIVCTPRDDAIAGAADALAPGGALCVYAPAPARAARWRSTATRSSCASSTSPRAARPARPTCGAPACSPARPCARSS